MNATESGIILLVKSAIKSKKIVLDDDFDWAEARRIINAHEIYGLVYYGLLNSGMEIPGWLKVGFMQRVAFLTRLWNAAEEVMSSFDDAGIEYIPLKGIKSKDLYPNRFMRHMSDVDILIHMEDYPKIKLIMQKLGFTEGVESDHELHFERNGLMLELHKRIIPSYNKDYYKITGDGWEWYREHDDFEYSFLHFTKHYRDAGVGIGHLVDLEILWEDKKLSDFALDTFQENVRKTLDVWFRDGIPDEKTKLIESTVFRSGEYGTKENSKASTDIKTLNKAKGNVLLANVKSKLGMIFLPWKAWVTLFPVLKHVPVLLPVFFIWRILRAPFRKKSRRNITNVIAKQNDYADKLASVGLEFKF